MQNTTVIDLPSEGKFYPEGHPLSDGEIEIRYMTAADEDVLTDQNLLRKGKALDRLLENVIVEDGVTLDDLLVGDKGAIVLATRVLAYGPNYAYEIDCPRCNETQEETVDLREIESKELPEDVGEGSREFSFELPVTEKQVKVELLTHHENQQIQHELKNTKRGANKKKLSGPSISKGITTRLKHLITEIDGEESKSEISSFVEQMPARDSHELRKFVRRINPDLDLTQHFDCDWCGHEEVMRIPLDANFLFPTE